MKKKRLLSLALAVTMLFGSAAALPEGVFSDSTSISASAETSGDWEYYYNQDNNTITITRYNGNSKTINIPSKINNTPVTALDSSGGFMDSNITYYDLQSNSAKKSDFCTVNIPSTVETINDYFFWSVKDVNKIVVDKNNKNFASYDGMLFSKDMTELLDCPEGKQGKVTIPSGTVNIGSHSNVFTTTYGRSVAVAPFEDCNGITEIKLPESVETIDSRNLLLCVNLEKINIPSKAYIYGNMFIFMRNNKLKTIEVSSKNPYYSSVNGLVLNKEKTEILACPVMSSVVVPDCVTILDFDSNNYVSDIENLTIGSGVIEIKSFPTTLKKLSVDSKNKFYSAVDNTLYNKSGSTLIKAINASGNYIVPDGVRVIDKNAFEGSSITSITMPTSVERINSFAFHNCKGLKSVTIPSGVSCIESSAFMNCANLESISIPKSVNVIGSDAFSSTKWLGTKKKASSMVIINGILIDTQGVSGDVTIPTNVKTIATNALYLAKAVSIKVGNNVTKLEEAAFNNLNELKSVVIGDGVNVLNKNTFTYCYNLESITIGKNIKSIDKDAFYCCSNLKQINIDSENKFFCFADGILYNKDKTEIIYKTSETKPEIVAEDGVCTVPEGVTWMYIGEYDSYSTPSVSNCRVINIPASVNYIEFGNSNGKYDSSIMDLEYINVDPDNKNYCSADGILYNKDKTKIIYVPMNYKSKKVIIPNTVTGIYKEFQYCKNIESIVVPNSVTVIGDEAFYGCENLANIKLPKSLTNFSYSSFSGTKYLDDLEEKSTYTIINGVLIARSNYEAKKLVIPDGVKIIDYGFSDYSSYLEELVIPDSVIEIRDEAFSKCYYLNSVKMSKNIQHIGDKVFYSSPWLENKAQSESGLVISDGILFNASGYKDTVLKIPNSVKVVADSIGRQYSGYGYQENEIVTQIDLPASVKYIGEDTFDSFENLTSITVDSDNPYYSAEGGVIYNKDKTKIVDILKSINKLEFPETVTNINEKFLLWDFCNGNLREIVFPSSYSDISEEIFYDGSGRAVNNLQKISFRSENSNYVIKDGILYNKEMTKIIFALRNIGSVIIPKSVTNIENCYPNETIKCYKGSYAEEYFKNYNCILIDYIPDAKIELQSDNIVYTGKQIKPDVAVSIDNKILKAGKDYKVSYKNNVNIGKATVTITGIGDYVGSASREFAIVKKTKADTTRLKGSGRFATAAAISTAAYPETAETVVLANGRKFYDALAGVTLANAYDAPILLTEANSLPTETLAEIKRLKAKKVIILGGSGSVGAEVKQALSDNKLQYEIVKGSSRFATAVEIANKTKEKTKTDPTEIFFVSSDKFADALSVSSIAALKNAPIIYLPKTGDIDDVTAAYLKTMKGKIKNAYVIGGSGVISNEVVKAAAKALGLTVDKTIVRVKGSTKFDTCVAVNTKFASVLNGESICVATGEDFPDALAGGVFAAQKSAPLFLAAGTLSDTQKSYLQTKNANSIFVFGGSKSVPDTLVQNIAKASVK